MSRIATVAKLLGPVIVTAFTSACGTMEGIKQDLSAAGAKLNQTFAPTPEQIAARQAQEAAEAAEKARKAEAVAAIVRNPNTYVAPSLNTKLAVNIHTSIQNNKRFNPQGQPMALNSLPCESALQSGVAPNSVAAMNPNNPNAAGNQVRGRVNSAINSRMQNSTIGQIFAPAVQGAQTAEAVQSKQLGTFCSTLVQANNLANSGQTTRAFSLVGNITNVAFSAGLIGVPGSQWSSETARGITADGVQGTIGVIGDKIVDKLPGVGQGGAFGDLLNKVPGLRR